MSDTDLQAIVRPVGLRVSPERESTMVDAALNLMTKTRMDMGWQAPGVYVRDSWLWNRHIAMRQYEDDFRHRLDDPIMQLWRVSNRSLNMPAAFIDQDFARLKKDLDSEKFFALAQEGEEDASPVLAPAERYLQKRAKNLRLAGKIKEDGLLGSLIRGEAVYKAIPSMKTRRVKRLARLVLDQTGQPAKDSKGALITEFDEWVPAPDDADALLLARDRKVVRRPAGMTPPLSKNPREMDVVEAYPSGSDIAFPYWADMILPTTACDLDSAIIKGHVFEMRVDELFDSLPNQLLNGARAEDYFKQAEKNAIMTRPDVTVPSWKRGEDPNTSQDDTAIADGFLGLSLYAELWFKYDIEGSGRRQDLMLLVDVERRLPIAYGLARDVLRSKTRCHPFDKYPLRIFPVPHRWYGRGYYSKDGDIHTEVDADYNRLAVEKSLSGNLLFENRNATEEGKAGLPLQFRTPATYKLAGAVLDVEDAVKVVTVTPQTREINEQMNLNQQTLFSRRGSVTPGETEGANLQAANTATGLQILRESKHEQVESRDDELKTGRLQLLQTFAQIELENLDETALESLLRGATIEVEQEQPVLDPATGQPATDPATGEPLLESVAVPVPAAPAVKQWAAEMDADQLSDIIQLVETKSRGQDIIQTNDNILKVIEKWEMTPPLTRKKIRPIFVQMLAALDVQNPDDYLETPEELEAMAAAEAQAAALEAGISQQSTTPGGAPPAGLPDQVAGAEAGGGLPPIVPRPENVTEKVTTPAL